MEGEKTKKFRVSEKNTTAFDCQNRNESIWRWPADNEKLLIWMSIERVLVILKWKEKNKV